MLLHILQTNNYGPREPWHDLHCKVEGPAAYDILTNFEQRWKKAKKRDFKLKKVANKHDDALIRLDRVSKIVTPTSDNNGDEKVRVSSEEDRENWHVQVQVKSDVSVYYIVINENINYTELVLNLNAYITGIQVNRFRIRKGVSKGCSRC